MAGLSSSLDSVVNSLISIPNASISGVAGSSAPTTIGAGKTTAQSTLTDPKPSQTKASQISSATSLMSSSIPASVVTASPPIAISHAASGDLQQHSATTQQQPVTNQQQSTSASVSVNVFIANNDVIQTKPTASISPSDSSTLFASVTTIPTSSSSTSLTSSALSSNITPTPSTTFATSTLSSSLASLSISAASGASIAGSALATGIPAAEDVNKVPVAGIVVASIMGFLALLTILFLMFRYCSPIRRRYDEWQTKKTEERTYRDGIDGVALNPEKLNRNGSPKPASSRGHRFYASDKPGPNTRVPQAQGTGLGLGNRLSLLMQHSPFQYGNSGVHPSQIGVAVSDPKSKNLPR